MRPLLLVGLWLGLVALACGCGPQRCYDAVSLFPNAGKALVFDSCRGAFGYVPFALPQAPQPEPAPQPDFYDNSEKRDI